jgi:hypothetical protein
MGAPMVQDEKPGSPQSTPNEQPDPYKPLPGENIQQYLQRVPGPVRIVSVTPPKQPKPN